MAIPNPRGRSEWQAQERGLDRVFAALANGTRRRLLMRLARGPASVSELAEPFAMSLQAVSSHIRVLEGAGLLRRERDGRMHRCALEALPLRDAGAFVGRYRVYWEETLQALARYAEAGPEAPRVGHGADDTEPERS